MLRKTYRVFSEIGLFFVISINFYSAFNILQHAFWFSKDFLLILKFLIMFRLLVYFVNCLYQLVSWREIIWRAFSIWMIYSRLCWSLSKLKHYISPLFVFRLCKSSIMYLFYYHINSENYWFKFRNTFSERSVSLKSNILGRLFEH